MCDKVMTALQVNAQVKIRKRKEISQATGYITTSSSEIMHEASFTHRTKLNLSSLQQMMNNSTIQLRPDIADAGLSSLNNFPTSQKLLINDQIPSDLAATQLSSADREMPKKNETRKSSASRNPSNYQNFYQQPLDQIEQANINNEAELQAQ